MILAQFTSSNDSSVMVLYSLCLYTPCMILVIVVRHLSFHFYWVQPVLYSNCKLKPFVYSHRYTTFCSEKQSIRLKFCRLLELSKRISLDFKFRCYVNQNQNDCRLLKKGLLFKERGFSKTSWNNTVFIITAGYIIFEEKLVIHSSYYEKTIFFCFWSKAYYSCISCNSNEIWNLLLSSNSLQSSKQIEQKILRYCTFICSARLHLWRHFQVKIWPETYKMATSILLKFQTLKCDISRTIWRIEVSDGSLFCTFHALSFELNLFFDRTCPLSFLLEILSV